MIELSQKHRPYYKLDYECQDITKDRKPLIIDIDEAYVGTTIYTFDKPYITFNLFDKDKILDMLAIEDEILKLIPLQNKPVFMKKQWRKFRVNPDSEITGVGSAAEYYNIYSISMSISKTDARNLAGYTQPISMKVHVKCISYTEHGESIKLVLESYSK